MKSRLSATALLVLLCITCINWTTGRELLQGAAQTAAPTGALLTAQPASSTLGTTAAGTGTTQTAAIQPAVPVGALTPAPVTAPAAPAGPIIVGPYDVVVNMTLGNSEDALTRGTGSLLLLQLLGNLTQTPVVDMRIADTTPVTPTQTQVTIAYANSNSALQSRVTNFLLNVDMRRALQRQAAPYGLIVQPLSFQIIPVNQWNAAQQAMYPPPPAATTAAAGTTGTTGAGTAATTGMPTQQLTQQQQLQQQLTGGLALPGQQPTNGAAAAAVPAVMSLLLSLAALLI